MQDAKLWRGMTRAELDIAYDNVNAVKDSAARREGWAQASERFRAQHSKYLDLPYGPRERNRIDIFPCGSANAPLLLFFHGGYWQRNSKEVFACFAAGPIERGIDVAFAGYTLAPEATLTEIVAEAHAATRWLRREGPGLGFAKKRLIVSGWSAGGHLTAMTIPLPEVDAGLAISGIFDVEPCRLNNLNDKLRLTQDEALAISPLHHLPRRKIPLVIAYGAAELPELCRQSIDYHAAWNRDGGSAKLLPLAGHNHFSIMDEMSSPGGALCNAALRLAS